LITRKSSQKLSQEYNDSDQLIITHASADYAYMRIHNEETLTRAGR